MSKSLSYELLTWTCPKCRYAVCVDNLKIGRWDVVEWSTAHQSLTLMLHPWKQSGTNKLVVGMCISKYRYFSLATASAQPQPRCSCADHWGKKLTILCSFAHQFLEACWSSSMFQPFMFGSVVTVVYITLFDINSNWNNEKWWLVEHAFLGPAFSGASCNFEVMDRYTKEISPPRRSPNEQTNNQTNKQTNKPTNKQTNNMHPWKTSDSSW